MLCHGSDSQLGHLVHQMALAKSGSSHRAGWGLLASSVYRPSLPPGVLQHRCQPRPQGIQATRANTTKTPPGEHSGRSNDTAHRQGSASASTPEGPTFCSLHGEQHVTDVLGVVAGALNGPVQSLPAVLGVPVRPRAENKQSLLL